MGYFGLRRSLLAKYAIISAAKRKALRGNEATIKVPHWLQLDQLTLWL